MPYVLLGLHRYFRSQNTDGLVVAGAALWAQNLSSGYYMLFFGPFVALYALVEIAVSRAWRRVRVWRDLGIIGGREPRGDASVCASLSRTHTRNAACGD